MYDFFFLVAGVLRITGTSTSFLPSRSKSSQRWTHTDGTTWSSAQMLWMSDSCAPLRAISLWPFWTWELRLQGWMQRWGLLWGWRSFTDTRSTASMTAFKDLPEERWEFLSQQLYHTALDFSSKCDTKEIVECVQLFKMEWQNVAGWTGQGGSLLGTKRWATDALIFMKWMYLSSLNSSICTNGWRLFQSRSHHSNRIR